MGWPGRSLGSREYVSGTALGQHFGAGEDGIRVGVWIREGWAVGRPARSSPPFLVSGGWGVPPQGCARADAALTLRQALVISWDQSREAVAR